MEEEEEEKKTSKMLMKFVIMPSSSFLTNVKLTKPIHDIFVCQVMVSYLYCREKKNTRAFVWAAVVVVVSN